MNSNKPTDNHVSSDNSLPTKCPRCGAPLTVNSDADAAVCEHCGTPFNVAKAIYEYLSDGTNANLIINNADFDLRHLQAIMEKLGAAFERGQQKGRDRFGNEEYQKSPLAQKILSWIMLLLFAGIFIYVLFFVS